MKNILVNDLPIGQNAENEYRDGAGNVLIAKGALIDEARTNALKRRNINTLMMIEEGDDVRELLSIDDLDEFSGFDDDFAPLDDDPEEPEEDLPDIAKDIKRGEEGFKQIMSSSEIKKLDSEAEDPETLKVSPDGPSLDSLAKVMKLGERTEEYKKEINKNYIDAVGITKSLLNKLRANEGVDGKIVKGVVRLFVDTFMNDKHMLLNLATIRNQEEDYLFSHSVNTTLIAISIASSMGYSENQILEVGMGAILHDIGMLAIPKTIRFKEKKTKDDYFEIKKHPMLGVHMLDRITKIPQVVSMIVYQSHERSNKSGYPKGRGGRLIHDYSKIVMIADEYDAHCAGRPGLKALQPYKSMETLLRSVRSGLFDPNTVRAYLNYTSLFPVGSLTRLSTGDICKTLMPNGKHFAKPVVSRIINKANKLIPQAEVEAVDLSLPDAPKVTQVIDNNKVKVPHMYGF
ncbi:MAG: HD-GYP domain-containing protein [Fibrobacterota bacterium]